jgi:hypothetical protein
MNRFELVNIILEHIGIEAGRFTYKWVSAAEGVRFVKVITEFDGSISELGPFGEKERLDRHAVKYKMKAALRTVEGRTFRMVFARQAKQMKDEETFGEFPSKDKLIEMFKKEMNMYQTLLYLEEKERSAKELTGLLGIPEEQVMGVVETLKKKNMWDGNLI